MTDEEILDNLQKTGKVQEAAFKLLYLNFGKNVKWWFVGKGLSEYEADDLLHEVLIDILKNSNSYKKRGAVKSWMWQIARNKLADFYRTRNRDGNSVKKLSSQENGDTQTMNENENNEPNSLIENQIRKNENIENSQFQKKIDNFRYFEEYDENEGEYQRKVETNIVSEERNNSVKLVECVTEGLKNFTDVDPERAYALELVVEGVDGKEIAKRIGRSYDASRQFLTQCRLHFAPYIEKCKNYLYVMENNHVKE